MSPRSHHPCRDFSHNKPGCDIHYLSHLIRADEIQNKPFMNGANKFKVFVLFADNVYLASGWKWFPMLLGTIGNR